MDKYLIFSNLEPPHFRLQNMKIKPLIQLREMIAAALSSMTNLSKSFRTFIIETMELFLTSSGRMNFTQMARCGRSCESRFRQNFKKSFDWLSFNRHFLSPMIGHRIAIGIDPCFIPKAGKKTPGVDWFWSGCAGAIKHGLEILGLSVVDADAKDAVFLKAEQTFTQKFAGKVDLKNLDMTIFKEEYSVDGKLVYKLYTADVWAVSLGSEVRVVIVDYLDTDKKTQSRKVFFSTDLSLSARDIFDIYRTRFQLEFVFRDAKQFTGLTHCPARNKEALAFAFNASLSSVNVARAYARQEGHNLSVGATKTLLHNAAMVDRFIAMSAKHANLRLNNTDFKELLFYGVRTVA